MGNGQHLTLGILAISALGFLPDITLASTPPAGKVIQVKGITTLQRVGLDHLLKVKFRDDVFLQDKITTKEQSFVRVLLGGKAVVTVRELSVLTITEEDGHATIDIKSGILGLSAARKRMKPGEYIEIRTPHAIAAVRGTKLTTEVSTTTIFSMIGGRLRADLPSRSRYDEGVLRARPWTRPTCGIRRISVNGKA